MPEDSRDAAPAIKDFKPCPFCGRIWMSVRRETTHHFVQCLCGATGPRETERDKAIRRWNIRDQHLFWNPFRLSIRFPSDPSPVDFRGQLDSMDLATVLQMLNAREKTGILQLTREHAKSAICLFNGNIIAASDSTGLRLGQILVNNGMLTPNRLRIALKTARNSSKLLGDVLVRLGYVDEGTLKEVIHQQVQEAVLELFFWTSGVFEYRDCLIDFDRRHMRELSTIEIIMESARRMDEWSELRDRSMRAEQRPEKETPAPAEPLPFRLKSPEEGKARRKNR